MVWTKRANRMHATIIKKSWNAERNMFAESFGGTDTDASLLQMSEVGFVDPTDPRFESTVAAIETELLRGKHMFRYSQPDDFGTPEAAFNICTFWYIEALGAMGRRDEAREIFCAMLDCRNHVGLLSEDIVPDTGELWGNYPQTYSLVGIINSAMRLSERWESAI